MYLRAIAMTDQRSFITGRVGKTMNPSYIAISLTVDNQLLRRICCGETGITLGDKVRWGDSENVIMVICWLWMGEAPGQPVNVNGMNVHDPLLAQLLRSVRVLLTSSCPQSTISADWGFTLTNEPMTSASLAVCFCAWITKPCNTSSFVAVIETEII